MAQHRTGHSTKSASWTLQNSASLAVLLGVENNDAEICKLCTSGPPVGGLSFSSSRCRIGTLERSSIPRQMQRALQFAVQAALKAKPRPKPGSGGYNLLSKASLELEDAGGALNSFRQSLAKLLLRVVGRQVQGVGARMRPRQSRAVLFVLDWMDLDRDAR